MNSQQLASILSAQRRYFAAGKTRPVSARLEQLRRLRLVLQTHEADIHQALHADLGKSPTESDMTELYLVYSELDFMLRHTEKFARATRVPTPLAQFSAKSTSLPCPRGVTLILSPWNYPLLLTLDPLIDALAAGNTVILKPSAYAPATVQVLETIIREAFPPELVALVPGGRAENQLLLAQKFDYIFFTGSQRVGREVLRQAAEHLTPVALELGGKSPCIVEQSAKLKLAARRIVFGKFLNCGQTCVAPDYVCVDRRVAEPFFNQLKAELRRQYGAAPLENPSYGKIISPRHFSRLQALLTPEEIAFGGKSDAKALRIEPTLLYPASWESKAMEEEIFGPILPILVYDDLKELLGQINRRPHPLAFYFFSENQALARKVMEFCPFGGGCINDTVIHLATPHMGFGGVGESGMGAYHGRAGFEAFSHRKRMVNKHTGLDLPMRYAPYTPLSHALIRKFVLK